MPDNDHQPSDTSHHVKEIVVAYLANNTISPEALPVLIQQVREAFAYRCEAITSPPHSISDHQANITIAEYHSGRRYNIAPGMPDSDHQAITNTSTATDQKTLEHAVRQQPAVDPGNSIHPEFLVCLECGGHFQQLRKHLSMTHRLTEHAYREKWGLKSEYPMVSAATAATRSKSLRQYYQKKKMK